MEWLNDLLGTGSSSARAQNQMDRDFQAQQASTQWQRGVADMEKAGINPLAQFASGASSPSGSSGAGGQGSGVLNNIINSATTAFSNWAKSAGKSSAKSDGLQGALKSITNGKSHKLEGVVEKALNSLPELAELLA